MLGGDDVVHPSFELARLRRAARATRCSAACRPTCSTTAHRCHATPTPAGRATASIAPIASLQVHACHTRLREVQVLHDQLRALLEAGRDGDPPLQPRDIAVLAPDIDAVRAARRGGVRRRARHARANSRTRSPTPARWPARRSPTRSCACSHCRCARFGARGRARPAGRARDRRALRAGSRRLRARCRTGWKRPARAGAWMPRDRARHGARRGDAYTWSSRSIACCSATRAATTPTSPASRPGRSSKARRAERSMRCCGCCACCATRARSLAGAHAAGDSGRAALQRCSTTRFAPARDSADATIAAAPARRRSAASPTGAARAGYDAPVGTRSCCDQLRARTRREADARAPFLTGGVSFGRMVPMRLMPFRVICLLGMNDGEFPRRDAPRSGQSPRRRARHARERRTGDPLAARRRPLSVPAVVRVRRPRVLPELVRHGSARQQRGANRRRWSPNCSMPPPRTTRGDADARVREALVVRHALQPFSPAAFGAPHAGERCRREPNRAASVIDARWQPAAEREPRGDDAAPVFAPPTLAAAGARRRRRRARRSTACAASLMRPHAVYLREGLGLRLPEDEPPLPNTNRWRARCARRNYALRHAVFDAGCARAAVPTRTRCMRGCWRARWSRPVPTAARTVADAARGRSRRSPQLRSRKGFGDPATRVPFALACGDRRLARHARRRASATGVLRVVLRPDGVHGGHAVRHGLDRLCASLLGLDAARARARRTRTTRRMASCASRDRRKRAARRARRACSRCADAACARRCCSCPRPATRFVAARCATRTRTPRCKCARDTLDAAAQSRRAQADAEAATPRAWRCAAAIRSSTRDERSLQHASRAAAAARCSRALDARRTRRSTRRCCA